MAINLHHRADYHRCCGTKATSSPVRATSEVTRTAHLPGSVTMTIKATAEILVDGTVGSRSGIEWTLSYRPFPSTETEDGAFYEAFAGAVEGAMEEALQKARSLAVTDAHAASPGLAGGPSQPDLPPT